MPMRYLLDILYLLLFSLMAVLTIPYSKKRRELFQAFTRNFWGTAIPTLDGRPVVWIHAVSVGEMRVCRPLLEHLYRQRPDLQFVLSLGTSDAMTVASQEFPDTAIFYAPFDFSWSTWRLFKLLRPQALLIAENDFWPNMLGAAKRCNVPVAIFNSRMSVREQMEHRWNAWLLRPGLEHVRWWGVVSEQDANWIRRFFHVQPPVWEITGSLKFDGVVRDHADPRTQRIIKQFGFRPQDRILLAGSTHAPEEELLAEIATKLSAEFSQFRLVLAPRQPSRCDVIAKMLRRHRISFVRASQLNGLSDTSALVTLVDSIGMLRDAWGLADFAFVGGSLARHGGQNMIEPASYGIPVCFGPHIWNFQSVAADLLEAGAAVQIDSAQELERTVRGWLIDSQVARAIGTAARKLIQNRTDAIDRSLRGILSMLPQPTGIDNARLVANHDLCSLKIMEAR